MRGLDPDFNLVENIRPYAGSVMARQLLPSLSRKDMYKALRDLNRFFRDLPMDASRVIRELKEKGLELKLKHENLDEFGVRIDRASNRLSFSLIIAAIIIGSSIIMQLHIGPSVSGVPLLGAAGYIMRLRWGSGSYGPYSGQADFEGKDGHNGKRSRMRNGSRPEEGGRQ